MARINQNIVNRMEDKAIFLFDKYHWNKNAENLTRKECEEYIAEEDYDENYSIIKIDATPYNTVEEALNDNGLDCQDYFIASFGIK